MSEADRDRLMKLKYINYVLSLQDAGFLDEHEAFSKRKRNCMVHD